MAWSMHWRRKFRRYDKDSGYIVDIHAESPDMSCLLYRAKKTQETKENELEAFCWRS